MRGKIGYIAGERIVHRGDWFPSLEDTIFHKDDFDQDILQDAWDVAISAGCSVAIVEAQNGTVELTTVTGDNFFATLSRALTYSALGACGIEARIALDDITLCQIEVGFNDAKSEVQGRMVDDVDQTGGLPTPICVNGAAIVFDPTDSTIQNLCGVGVIASTGSVNDLGIALVNGISMRLRVQLDVLGNAYYYLNGALIATELLAITPGTLLTPWMTISNKAGAIGRVHTIDYVKWWQNRI